MSKVTISKNAKALTVESPYNAAFVKQARALNGKFSSGAWYFDPRDEARVRDLCRDVYGDDGVTADTCTLRVTMPGGASCRCGPIDFYGRTLGRAFGRDSGAKKGDEVVLLEGGFYSGGSVKNWYTYAKDGTTVLLRDFPRAKAEKLVSGEEPCEWSGFQLSIEDERPPVDVGALKAEQEKLMARLEEIHNLLSSVEEEVSS